MLARGAVAPDFTLSTLDGQAVSLSGLRGRVVVLHFWASWCGSPQQGLPQMAALQKRWGAQGVSVVAVNSWDNKAAMAAFLRAHGLNPTGQAFDPSVSNESIAVRLYQVPDVPACYVIDRSGRIAAACVGTGQGAMNSLQSALAALGVS